MRKLILFCLLLLSGVCFAQPQQFRLCTQFAYQRQCGPAEGYASAAAWGSWYLRKMPGMYVWIEPAKPHSWFWKMWHR